MSKTKMKRKRRRRETFEFTSMSNPPSLLRRSPRAIPLRLSPRTHVQTYCEACLPHPTSRRPLGEPMSKSPPP